MTQNTNHSKNSNSSTTHHDVNNSNSDVNSMSTQDELANFIKDKSNISKAIEGSMEKRLDAMTQDDIKKQIRYRVEQEYEKYHNDVIFEFNSKDFWIEQIENKLSETMQEMFNKALNLAVIEARIDELSNIKLKKYDDGYIAIMSTKNEGQLTEHDTRITQLHKQKQALTELSGKTGELETLTGEGE